MAVPVARQPSVVVHETSPVYRFKSFYSIESAAWVWERTAPANDVFLQLPYLHALESALPEGMRPVYLIFYREDEPVGVAYCQIQFFSGKHSYRVDEQGEKEGGFWKSAADRVKKWVAAQTRFNILICGNLLATGDHSYFFDENKIDPKAAFDLLDQAVRRVSHDLHIEGLRIPVALFKDIEPEKEFDRRSIRANGCLEFCIQPNMVLDLPYDSFEAYLGAMSTKYRTRAKRAFKKAVGIEKRELNAADVVQHQNRMYDLYKDVSDGAGFNMVRLNPGYFAGLKNHLNAHFRIFGYFSEGRLIAFFTTILNYSHLEAHFLGYEKGLNHDKQLYLNMLYDIVRVGISEGCREIVFARTALEIKSSIGAEPRQLFCFVRHRSRVVNRLGRSLFHFMNTEEKWQQRHPFKHGHDDA